MTRGLRASHESHVAGAVDDFHRDRIRAGPLPHAGFGDKGIVRRRQDERRPIDRLETRSGADPLVIVLRVPVTAGEGGNLVVELTSRRNPVFSIGLVSTGQEHATLPIRGVERGYELTLVDSVGTTLEGVGA